MESIPSKPLRNMASTSRTTQPPTNAGQHANTGSDLNVDQLVLERALAANRGHANKTAEDIKQEELLRRAAESKPTPPRPRQQVATTRKKAPAVTTSHATVEEDQRQKDEAALMQIVAQRSASANKEEADLTARIIESKTAAIATEAKGNPDDYVSEKGDAIDLLAIAARRSVDGTVTSQDNVPSGTAGDAPNPPNDIEYDNETGRPLVKDRMPAGSVAPGAYSGAPGAEYQALEPVRLDVLGSSDMSPAQGQAEPSTVDTSGMPTTGGATLVRSGGESDDPAETAVKDNADSKKNPMMIGAVVVFLFLVIVLAIAIPLAVRGGGTDGPEAQSTNEEGEVDLFLPTRAPDTDMEAYLLSLVPEETAEVIAVSQQLEVSGNKTAAPASLSPPVEAFRWMLEHQSLIEYSDARLLQRFSLATLYYTTEGQAWTRGGQWLSFDQHECSWDERVIECEGMWEEDNYFGGVVTAIKLLRNRLEGSIPNELSLLSNVGVVDLSGNELKGSMPYTIGNMNNLTSLVLDDNQLSGQIPSEMGLLTSLRRFSAQDNSLNGTLAPELGDMIDLSDLVLSRNQISGALPSSIGQLTKLNRLYLDGNMLSGSLPEEMGSLTGLIHLYLNQNQLWRSIPSSFGQLKALRSLSLHSNFLTGSIPTQVGDLQMLLELSLKNNSLQGLIPGVMGTSLRTISLNSNRLRGPIPDLSSLSMLSDLRLNANRLTSTIPTGLPPALRHLALDSNRLSGPIHTEMGLLTNLDELWLFGNQLTGTVPSELGLCSSLHRLNMDRNQLQGTLPDEINNLVLLREFNISNTQISGTFPGSFCQIAFNDFTCSTSMCGCGRRCPCEG